MAATRASPGGRFAHALAAKDFDRPLELFGPEVEALETDGFADRERVGYRFRVRNPEGMFLVEQQLFIAAEGGPDHLDALGLLGLRPLADGG